jgi:diguanylate cyclase (GGDEF)-like protein
LIHVNDEGTCLCKDGCPIQKTIREGSIQQNEVYLHHKSGQRVPVIVKTSPIRNNSGEIIGAVEIFADNTNMKMARRKVDELNAETMLDELTNIANRKYLQIKLASSLAEYKEGNIPFGIVFMDIDNFKQVNDIHGHLTGDLVLKAVTTTLKNCLRATDHIGRWGGEEFLAILPGINELQLPLISEKLRNLVQQSHCMIDDQIIEVTISLGSTFVIPEDTSESILARADELLYQSKAGGRNRYTIG